MNIPSRNEILQIYIFSFISVVFLNFVFFVPYSNIQCLHSVEAGKKNSVYGGSGGGGGKSKCKYIIHTPFK
jgi:hypothetical protein